MSCDVVVLTRTPSLFARCLRRVPSWTHRIVIDNGGDAATEKMAAEHGWTYHCPGYNTSFSTGVNLGFGLGNGVRVLALNDDALLTPGALEAMLAHDEPIVGALIMQPDGLVNHAGVSFSGRYPVQIGWQTPTYPEFKARRCGQVEAVTFACALIGREVFHDVGGLDDSYWYGYEDVDFCAAAAEKGHRSFMCYEATVIHSGHGTRTFGADRPGIWTFLERWVLHTDRARRALANVGMGRDEA